MIRRHIQYDLIQPALFTMLALYVFMAASCSHDRLDIDLSGIEPMPVNIERFDRDLFSITESNVNEKLPAVKARYGGFATLYLANIVCPQNIHDSACIPQLLRFISDKDMRKAYADCQKSYPDMNAIQADFEQAFRYYRYYFKGLPVPRIYAMMSGFNYAIAAADSSFGIGLEMYLGEGYEYYEMMQIPRYKQVNMRKEYIVNDFFKAWMMRAFPNQNKSNTLLNEMIYQGKLLYMADALMPAEQDSIKIGFSQAQLDWCDRNASNVWGYLIKNKMLYSTDITIVTKFTGDAPFTAGFVKESPGRTGVWLGWKIVRSYMEKHPDVTLLQLMNDPDAPKILSQSGFKP